MNYFFRFFILVLLALSLLFPAQSLAMNPYQGETTLTSLLINQKISFDLEMILTKEGSRLIPIKYLAELLDISVAQSEDYSALTFTSPLDSERVRIDFEKRLITQGNRLTTLPKEAIAYVESGLFTEHEIFLEQSQVEQLLNVQIVYSNAKTRMEVSVSRPIRVTIQYEYENAKKPGSRTEIQDSTVVSPEKDDQFLKSITFSVKSFQNKLASESGFGSQANQFGQTIISPTFKGELKKVPFLFTPFIAYGNQQFGLNGIEYLSETTLGGKPLKFGTLNSGLSTLVCPRTLCKTSAVGCK